MTKLLSILAVSALALSLNGVALADDETPLDPYPKTRDQTGAAKTQDQAGSPTQQSKQYEEYLAVLKKCQDLDATKQQSCIEQARQKYNRM